MNKKSNLFFVYPKSAVKLRPLGRGVVNYTIREHFCVN